MLHIPLSASLPGGNRQNLALCRFPITPYVKIYHCGTTRQPHARVYTEYGKTRSDPSWPAARYGWCCLLGCRLCFRTADAETVSLGAIDSTTSTATGNNSNCNLYLIPCSA